MIISCPECLAKFMVDNEAFGAVPRKVRCGKCEHIWQQEPPSPEQVGVERQVRKEQKDNLSKAFADDKAGIQPNLPTVIEASKITKWLKVACWLLFAGNIFAFILLNKPLIGQTAFYDLIGDYDSAGVKIQDVKFSEPSKSKNKTTYFFDWAVKSDRQEPIRVPHVRLSLLNADKELIFATAPSESTEVLAKNGKFAFSSNKLVDETKQGRYVVIDIGNPYEIETR